MGFERPTFRLRGQRSNQLCHRRGANVGDTNIMLIRFYVIYHFVQVIETSTTLGVNYYFEAIKR